MQFHVFLPLAAAFLTSAFAGDWLSFGGDPQRTSWAKNETSIGRENIQKLRLEWKLKLPNESKELNSLTVPVVATGIETPRGAKDFVVVAGASDVVFAVDPSDGEIVWSKRLQTEGASKQKPDWLCPNALNATPAIDRQTRSVYVLASDGKLHTLNVTNGEAVSTAIPFTPPFGKTWSLNLHNRVLYTTISQGCNSVRSSVWAIDMRDPEKKVARFVSGPAGGAGIWGRAGVAITSAGLVVAETGDARTYDVAAGKFPDTFLGLSEKDLKLADYYTPANRAWITEKDLDMGNTSPAVFKFKNRELIAGAGKEGVIYLLDAKQMGGSDHRTPLFRSPLYTNGEADFEGRGFWGALASWTDNAGGTWLLAPAWGPQTPGSPKFKIEYGDAPSGSIMAFKVVERNGTPVLEPAWRSRDMNVPEPPVVANGLVFAISNQENTRQVDDAGRLYTSRQRAEAPSGNATLYVFNALTGEELWSSGDAMQSFTHLGGIAIAQGKVYVTTFDNMLYAFSVPDEQGRPGGEK